MNIKDCYNILDYYNNSKDDHYKEGLKEITPFKDKIYFYRLGSLNINLTSIIILLIKIKTFFHLPVYKKLFTHNGLIFILKELSDKEIFLKGSINGKSKVFIKINKKSIKKGKSIEIEEIISIEKGMGKKTVMGICKYYDIYNIVVEPSVYGKGFWKKMKKEYKGEINIFIK